MYIYVYIYHIYYVIYIIYITYNAMKMVNKHPINLSCMKLMSKKQSMLNPSKTNFHKEGTGNA